MKIVKYKNFFEDEKLENNTIDDKDIVIVDDDLKICYVRVDFPTNKECWKEATEQEILNFSKKNYKENVYSMYILKIENI